MKDTNEAPPDLSLTLENALERYSEMEQRLHESEEIARIGSWKFDVATQKSVWSPATFHLLGFDPEQGEPDLETFRLRFHPDDRNKFTETVQKALTSGSPYSVHARIVLEDDSIRWIQIRGRPSQADDGSVTRLRGVVQDITERMQYLSDFVLVQEQLKESAEAQKRQREYLRSVIDASSEVIFVLDTSGVFTLANQTLARNSRLTVQEIVGKRFTDFVHAPGTMERISDYIVRALSSPDETFLFDEKITLDDRIVWSQTMNRAIPSLDGKRYEVLFISTDITERKQAMEEAERARDAAEAANRAKSEFLANMSHEIRTPMNGVLGMTELLGYTSMTAEQQDYVATLQQSAEALLVVIDDILDFSKLEAGRVELHPEDYNIRSVIDEVMALMVPTAKKKMVALESSISVDIPTLVHGDSGRLRQVLLNLVGNALKFTERGSISLNCRLLEKSDETVCVCLEVTDTGPGISLADQERLFRSFSQVDSSVTRRFGGTGLGLAISKQLVELMDGAIGVYSTLGRGSTFWIELPLQLK